MHALYGFIAVDEVQESLEFGVERGCQLTTFTQTEQAAGANTCSVQ